LRVKQNLGGKYKRRGDSTGMFGELWETSGNITEG